MPSSRLPYVVFVVATCVAVVAVLSHSVVINATSTIAIAIVVVIGVAITNVVVAVAIGLQLRFDSLMMGPLCVARLFLLTQMNMRCADPHDFLFLADNVDGAHRRHHALGDLQW